MTADSIYCDSCMDDGATYGLEFSTFWDSHTFSYCDGGSLHVAGLMFQKIGLLDTCTYGSIF